MNRSSPSYRALPAKPPSSLHADETIYPGGFYQPADLDRWAARIEGWLHAGQDCYTYFDNDTKTRAPIDAMSLIERLRPSA